MVSYQFSNAVASNLLHDIRKILKKNCTNVKYLVIASDD